MHKRKPRVMILASVGVLVLALVVVLQYYGILPKRTYSSQHFGIDVVYSSQDYNHNGVDDYTDFTRIFCWEPSKTQRTTPPMTAHTMLAVIHRRT